MSPGLALVIVIVILVLAWLADRYVWRRCRCGDRICNGCGRHR